MDALDQQKKDELYQSLMAKYDAADKIGQDGIDAAKKDASSKNMWAGIIDGVTQLGQANAVSRGMSVPKSQGGDILRRSADQSVSGAAADRKAEIEKYLMKDRLSSQVDSQLMGEKDRADKAAQTELDNQFREKKLKADTDSDQLRAKNDAANRKAMLDANALQQNEKKEEHDYKLTTPYGMANSEGDAKILKEAHESKQAFDSKIQEMIDLRTKYGGEMFNREAVSRGKQLSKDLLLEYKNMAKLGVLSKSDEGIINAIIPADPLAFSLVPGQDPIMNNLKKFKEDSDKDFVTRVNTRTRNGMMPKADFPKTVTNDKGETATVANADELAEANAEGFN